MRDDVGRDPIQTENVEIWDPVENSSCFPSGDWGKGGESEGSSHAEAHDTDALALRCKVLLDCFEIF